MVVEERAELRKDGKKKFMDDQTQAENQQTQEATAEELQEQELKKLEQSFTKVSSYKNPLQREQAISKESRDLNIPLDECRRLYELSKTESSTPTKLHKFWKWTGVGEKKGWDFIQLLVVPIALGIAGTYVQDQIKKSEKEAAKDSANQATLNNYLDEMIRLLPNLGKVGVKSIVKTRTLTTLRSLDSERTNQLLVFLIETKLIVRPPGASIIDFKDANLHGADLKGVDLSGIDLSKANLVNADLSGAKLIGANLSEAKLKDAKLDNANLSEANLKEAKVELKDLGIANFCNATMPDGHKSSQVCSWKVDAETGLTVRNSPAGYAIGGIGFGEQVGLTGAEQYAEGRRWSQLSNGGWIALDYLSLQPSEKKSSQPWFFWNHGDK